MRLAITAAALIMFATAQAPAVPVATAEPSAAVTAAPPAAAYCAMIPFGAGCKPLLVAAPRAQLHLSVVTTDKARERGLMLVPDVPAHEGMLFVFSGGDQSRGFWMKNTITPLDMVWVRANGTVTFVAPNVPKTKTTTPDDQIPRRDGVGTYVIELRAGDAARDGIVRGTHLALPSIAAE